MIHKIYYICNIYLMYTQYNRYIYIYICIKIYCISDIFPSKLFSCG